MKSFFSIAAASLGLGIAVIVDQPAAFARCDRGSCPCRDIGTWKDKVDDGKCSRDKFCAQVVAAKWGTDHVYVCEPRKPAGWGCNRDRQCKSSYCMDESWKICKGFREKRWKGGICGTAEQRKQFCAKCYDKRYPYYPACY